MAMSDQRVFTELQFEDDGSESEYDSDNDPNFSIGDTSTNLSGRSINKKSKASVNPESESDEEEVSEQTFDETDANLFELVQKVIEAGQIEKLKVEQCKVYLRKNGLRLAGNKGTLIQRIKEHLEILNGDGEKKYSPSSFTLNCKGDACMGDVVMFEQNVYEMFNLASRSASGPPCGTRIVVGRIVKESYGAAKQQHTFTIEVLWSKGEKPLPPLHPLLIKGRNLYRLKTLRQRWEDEGQRQKILMEKHSRGSLARSDREARVEEKKMRKMLKATRISGKAEPKKKQAQSNSTVGVEHRPTGCLVGSRMVKNQFIGLAGTSQLSIGLASHFQQVDSSFHQLTGSMSQYQQSNLIKLAKASQNSRESSIRPQHAGLAVDYANVASVHNEPYNQMQQMDTMQRIYHGSMEVQHQRSFNRHANFNHHSRLQDHLSHNKYSNGLSAKVSHVQPLGRNTHTNLPQREGHTLHQPCQHYAKGRCYFGENCKFMHELREEYPQRRQEAYRHVRNDLGSRSYRPYML